MIGIYKIENTKTGEVYIGQSTNIEVRWANHRRNAMMKGKAGKYALYRSMRYYGPKMFEFSVLETCKQDELDARENYWITYYAALGHCYNMIYPKGVTRK